jgi:hypothetical protein
VDLTLGQQAAYVARIVARYNASLPTAREAADRLAALGEALRRAEEEGRLPRFEDMVHAAGRKLPGDRGYRRHRLRRWLGGED